MTSTMHMLYNSDSFAVVQFEMDGDAAEVQTPVAVGQVPRDLPLLTRDGFEIVDKFARREIFIEGALAERFKAGVEDLVQTSPSEDEFDAFVENFAALAQHPVSMH